EACLTSTHHNHDEMTRLYRSAAAAFLNAAVAALGGGTGKKGKGKAVKGKCKNQKGGNAGNKSGKGNSKGGKDGSAISAGPSKQIQPVEIATILWASFVSLRLQVKNQVRELLWTKAHELVAQMELSQIAMLLQALTVGVEGPGTTNGAACSRIMEQGTNSNKAASLERSTTVIGPRITELLGKKAQTPFSWSFITVLRCWERIVAE
ncbi:unnamed protein product, partial [Amoebophrya sp. A120]